MPALQLTDRTVASLDAPPQGRLEYYDAQIPGLALRITADGVKSWCLMYRNHGRRRRLTLGRYPDVGLAKARKIATRERGRIVDGVDPGAEKQIARAADDETVGALYDLYKPQGQKLRTWPEYRRIFENEVLPKWRHMRVKDVTRRGIRDLLRDKAASAPVMANRIFHRVSALLSFAAEEEWIDANPALKMSPPGGEETSRDRVLTRDEVRELWPALHETKATDAEGKSLRRLSQLFNDGLLMILLTAQRPGEIWRMRWPDLDLENRWWEIPRPHSKNKQPHRVWLTDEALKILKARKRQQVDDVFVFATRPKKCIAARGKKAASRLSRGLSFGFRAHDLRRTASSYMGEAGVGRFHIALVLNHRSVTHSTVTAIYDRYQYDDEKRDALETWARVLDGILKNKQGSAKILAFPDANKPADQVPPTAGEPAQVARSGPATA